MKVSICVAYYNRSDALIRSINSLLNQDFDDYEIIVVNDGSKDPLTKQYLDEFDDKRLTVIHQNNTGFVGAMRKAIETAQGEYIAVHGAGDVSLPSRITKQAMFLDENPNVGVVSCQYENVVIGGERDGERTLVSKDRFKISVDDFLGAGNPFGHGEVMYRKELYAKVGGYREFFKHAQDRDLWLRMISHCEMVILPELLYERGHFTSDGVATNPQKMIYQKYLATFAKQCYFNRKEMGSDYIDRYGMGAGLFRKRDRLLAHFCSAQALHALYFGNMDMAKEYLKLSVEESLSITNVFLSSALYLSKNTFMKTLIQKVISFHPNSKSWY